MEKKRLISPMEETENRKGEKSLEQLEEEVRMLKEENERLQSLTLKERMYDRVHLSVKTMDRIILCLVLLFVLVIILGMIKGT